MDNIVRLNIADFRTKLATEQDEKTRQLLRRLLAEEEAKLATLQAPTDTSGLSKRRKFEG
jgi:hypothetical protein